MLERDRAGRLFWVEVFSITLFFFFADRGSGETNNSREEPKVSVLGRPDAGLVLAVNKAVQDASRRLSEDRCQAVFSDFKDASGTTLQGVLEGRRQSATSYLRWLVFVNGSEDQSCLRSQQVAGTNPGDRIVRLCGSFKTIQITDPGYAAALIIHEELHSLGLPENPPSSAAITNQVVARCGR